MTDGPNDPRARTALPLSAEQDAVVRDFHTLYYNHWLAGSGTLSIDWRGFVALKCPLDLWIYQELINRRRPDLIVETGTAYGGSGLYLADMCALAGHGEVVSIDLRNGDKERLPKHERLTHLAGSSTAPEVVGQVHARARDAREVMVILDSDHYAVHVMAELQAYAPLIRPGGYLIVEDGNVNGRPVLPDFGPGPGEATIAFLANNPEFERDPACERFLMTCNPGGYLRRREQP